MWMCCCNYLALDGACLAWMYLHWFYMLTVQHDAQMDYYGTKLATCSSDRSVKIFDIRGDQQVLIADLKGSVRTCLQCHKQTYQQSRIFVFSNLLYGFLVKFILIITRNPYVIWEESPSPECCWGICMFFREKYKTATLRVWRIWHI